MSIVSRTWLQVPEILGLILSVAAQIQLGMWLLQSQAARASVWLRGALKLGVALVSVWVALAFLFNLSWFWRLLPDESNWWAAWARGAAIAWALASLGAVAAWALLRRVPQYDAGRRGFVRAAGAAVAAVPFGAVGFGILVQRSNFRVREVDIPVSGLPQGLHGVRLVQFSDIHLSPFLSEGELARAVGLANELRPHLVVVTGDLITSAGDPLDGCLRQLSKLRADAGILGCLGNHEIYAEAEDYATEGGRRLGIRFLRQSACQLRFGSGVLNVAGVDYQRKSGRYLQGAGKLLVPGAANVLLSHNPDVFPVAAEQGYDLTIAGHTHGGQVTVEVLHQTLNVARFYTPYVYGLYRQGPASVYVTRGIGTVGIPARLGAPPEIALLRLCAT
jgi:predicted MPP superfamily phosphohydrolase